MSGSRISAEEMRAASASNAYDAVQRLRPSWLTTRGARSTQGDTQIVVAVNGNYFGPVDSLRQFSVDELEAISYLGSGSAALGIRGVGPGIHVEAAILIELRGARR